MMILGCRCVGCAMPPPFAYGWRRRGATMERKSSALLRAAVACRRRRAHSNRKRFRASVFCSRTRVDWRTPCSRALPRAGMWTVKGHLLARDAEGRLEQLPELARELVGLRVEVIIAVAAAATWLPGTRPRQSRLLWPTRVILLAPV